MESSDSSPSPSLSPSPPDSPSPSHSPPPLPVSASSSLSSTLLPLSAFYEQLNRDINAAIVNTQAPQLARRNSNSRSPAKHVTFSEPLIEAVAPSPLPSPTAPVPAPAPAISEDELAELKASHEIALADKDLVIRKLQTALQIFQHSSPSSVAPASLLAEYEAEIGFLIDENRRLRQINKPIKLAAKIITSPKPVPASPGSPPPRSVTFSSSSSATSSVRMLSGSLRALNQDHTKTVTELNELKKKERRYLSGLKTGSDAIEKLAAASHEVKRLRARIAQMNDVNNLLDADCTGLDKAYRLLKDRLRDSEAMVKSLSEENRILRLIQTQENTALINKLVTGKEHTKQQQEEAADACDPAFDRLEKSILTMDRQRLSQSAAMALTEVDGLRARWRRMAERVKEAENQQKELIKAIINK